MLEDQEKRENVLSDFVEQLTDQGARELDKAIAEASSSKTFDTDCYHARYDFQSTTVEVTDIIKFYSNEAIVFQAREVLSKINEVY